MPPTLTYPGVYVQEVASGVRTIVGVSTSTALFIGRSADGPLDEPVRCNNITDFRNRFSDDSTLSELPRQVKLFFQNGGTTCYVMRIANGAKQAAIQLMTEEKVPKNSILLTAKNHGVAGNQIRAAIDYDTDLPESTFNIELFRWQTDPNGNRTKQAAERWRNLSMNPASPTYAPTFLSQTSKLVNATYAGAPVAADGFSQSGRAVDVAAANFAATWAGILDATHNQFEISVDGSRFVPVDLSTINLAVANTDVLLLAELEKAVRKAFAPMPANPGAQATVTFQAAPSAKIPPDTDTPKWIRVTATKADVVIRPSTTNDVAVRLMLGTAQGGYEVGAYAAARPAPTGMSLLPSSLFGATKSFAALDPAAVTGLTLDGQAIPFNPAGGLIGLQTAPGGPPGPAIFVDADTNSPSDHGDGIREKLRLIARYVSDFAANTPGFPWRASVAGYRLRFVFDGDTADNATGALSMTGWTGPNGFAVTENVRYASLGTTTAPFQTNAVAGIDGSEPKATDYEAAFEIADREIDIFNLLLLPAANGVDQTKLWGAASVFCNKRRAFLVMDAPPWADLQAATKGVNDLRIGLVKDYAAVYHPRLTVRDNDLEVQVGPSGAIAGLMARTDSNRGVWKAPAGTEADLRAVVGLERRYSDAENGALNPKAINTLRVFPSGVVCWGARTMDGDDANASEYKYVPVRRLALFIEESLYRGLRWVVFEPNDEPLWAQIRLNVGAFMHGLFTEGAFQGQKSTDAYFVRCDKETTSQDDRNKGIVNIWVGFAPLKPAEFVVLHLQQIAGEIKT